MERIMQLLMPMKVVQQHDAEISNLFGVHSLSECNTVSSFAVIGKATVLKRLMMLTDKLWPICITKRATDSCQPHYMEGHRYTDIFKGKLLAKAIFHQMLHGLHLLVSFFLQNPTAHIVTIAVSTELWALTAALSTTLLKNMQQDL